MSAYVRDIVKLLACSDPDAGMIEYIMREEILHSTLDWLPAAEFNRAARKAASRLAEDRGLYEEFFAATRAAFRRLKTESESKIDLATHEI